MQLTDPKPPVAVNFSAAVRALRIVDCTKYAKKLNFKYRVGMSRPLFSLLWPVAQDGYKGETFDERLDNLLKEFKRHAEFAIDDSIMFSFTIGTMVKEYRDKDEIHEHKVMKKEDVEVLATSPDDETGEPCLIFFHKAEYEKYKFKEIIHASSRTAKKS